MGGEWRGINYEAVAVAAAIAEEVAVVAAVAVYFLTLE